MRLLAVRGELRPVRRHRRVRRRAGPRSTSISAARLVTVFVVDQTLTMVSSVHGFGPLGVAPAAPDVDDGLAVDVDRDARAELVPARSCSSSAARTGTNRASHVPDTASHAQVIPDARQLGASGVPASTGMRSRDATAGEGSHRRRARGRAAHSRVRLCEHHETVDRPSTSARRSRARVRLAGGRRLLPVVRHARCAGCDHLHFVRARRKPVRADLVGQRGRLPDLRLAASRRCKILQFVRRAPRLRSRAARRAGPARRAPGPARRAASRSPCSPVGVAPSADVSTGPVVPRASDPPAPPAPAPPGPAFFTYNALPPGHAAARHVRTAVGICRVRRGAGPRRGAVRPAACTTAGY